MNTLDKILLIVGIFIALFIVSCLIIFCAFQSEPVALISGVLGAGGIEAILCAVIQIKKPKDNKDENID